jgi:uncharacterized protein (DUF302 family)
MSLARALGCLVLICGGSSAMSMACASETLKEQSVDTPSIDGLIVLPTKRTVADVLARVASIAQAKGLTVFAKIDFSGDAAKSNLSMAASGLVIFGNPVAGTPVMVAAPTSAIDLPLKILAFEQNGHTWVAYNDPKYLQKRHGFPAALVNNLAPIGGLAQAAAADN